MNLGKFGAPYAAWRANTLPTLAPLDKATASSYPQRLSRWIAEGQVYVSDEYTHRISIFDSSGVFLSNWGKPGARVGELGGPSGLAFDHDDNLYIADHLNNRIQKFTGDGRFLLSFGSEGADDGQFNLPWGLTVDLERERCT